MAREPEDARDHRPSGDDESPERPARRVRRFAWLALLPLAAWLWLFDGGWLEQRRLQASLDSLATAEEGLQAEILRLKELNRALEAGDPFAVEAEARRLGMAREGDEVWRVMLEEDTLRSEGSRP